MCVIFESLARISLKPFDAQELSIALFFLSPIYNPQKCFNGSHNVYHAKVRKAPPTKLELSHSIGGMLFPAISRPFHEHAWHYVASASAKIEAPGGHFTRDFLRLSTPDSSGSQQLRICTWVYSSTLVWRGRKIISPTVVEEPFTIQLRVVIYSNLSGSELLLALEAHTHTTPVVVGGYLQ